MSTLPERLRRRVPLFALLGSDLISVTGTTLTTLAVPWFVLETTGSAARTGIASAVALAPIVLSAGFGGALVDRIGFRRASVLADLASGLLVAAIPLLHRTVGLPFWALLVLLFGRWLLATPGETARQSLLPEAAAHTGTPIERAAAGLDGVSRGGKLLGAPLAGVLIAAFGTDELLVIDAASFAVSAALIGVVARGVPEPGRTGDGSYLTRLRDGFAFLARHRLLRALVTMILLTNLLDAAYGQVLLPVYARDVLHSPVALGAISGAFSAGAMLGTLLYGTVGARLPRWATFTVAFLLGGGPRFGLLVLGLPMPLLLAAMFLLAIGAGAINPLLGVVEYERIPAALRARVLGAVAAGAWAALPLGGLLAGFLVEAIGLEAALLTCGTGYLAATLSPLIGRVWRELDRRPVPHVPETTHAS